MGVRAGQGFGQSKPKRLLCPDCGKRGVTGWTAGPAGLCRHCQYCQASWGSEGWQLAQKLRTVPALTPAARVRELFGQYWDLAFKEGKTGCNQAEAANAVLVALEGELAQLAVGAYAVPPFNRVASAKLDALVSQGFEVSGVSIERPNASPEAVPERGFVTAGGLVGWWRPQPLRQSLEELQAAATSAQHPAQTPQWREAALAKAQGETMPPMSPAAARWWWFHKGVFSVLSRPAGPAGYATPAHRWVAAVFDSICEGGAETASFDAAAQDSQWWFFKGVDTAVAAPARLLETAFANDEATEGSGPSGASK